MATIAASSSAQLTQTTTIYNEQQDTITVYLEGNEKALANDEVQYVYKYCLSCGHQRGNDKWDWKYIPFGFSGMTCASAKCHALCLKIDSFLPLS
ncbi:hypothetical protein [Simkania sp.]|uniref:hypothetical protein n=1 Tax=Simkania sp. TaxID=34094 RepID=UPI003B51B847